MTSDAPGLHFVAMHTSLRAVRCPLLVGRDDLLGLADRRLDDAIAGPARSLDALVDVVIEGGTITRVGAGAVTDDVICPPSCGRGRGGSGCALLLPPSLHRACATPPRSVGGPL